jgi:hypothetical protein
LLTPDDLKNWLHRDLPQADNVLLALGTFDRPARVQDIKNRARDAGSTKLPQWNISMVLERTRGLAILTKTGWELTNKGKERLRALGVSKISPAATQVGVDLRFIAQKIQEVETRAFVEETIKCYEYELYRSAVVMSWLAAVDVLKKYVLATRLTDFNAEAQKANPKWRIAKNSDEIGLMKEFDLLNRLAMISVFGKNVNEQLHECLKLRNACGHPNSLKLGPNTVARHLEILILNVFERFAK